MTPKISEDYYCKLVDLTTEGEINIENELGRAARGGILVGIGIATPAAYSIRLNGNDSIYLPGDGVTVEIKVEWNLEIKTIQWEAFAAGQLFVFMV